MIEDLNREQLEAATHYEGPLLILAGAGSGKTRVLTSRTAWLIDEKHVDPWNILAITFTNKAAGEMRERVEKQVGFGADKVWVSTFHSLCARILRRYIGVLGYESNYTIYDTEDQKTLMKNICKSMEINTKLLREQAILHSISRAKDELTGPDEFMSDAGSDSTQQTIGRVYKEYQAQLKKNNALDFDDLIMLTVQLFEKSPEVLEYYRNRFKFIMVDEYQDTNTAQFRLVSTLAGPRGNLCVVGDDDQSIYRFRGANIFNILNFEKVYPDTKVVRLEQNYRSTQNILNVANAVISNNKGRKEKKLWTENEEGSLVSYREFSSGLQEASFIAGDIGRRVRRGEGSYSDFAVLYRTNAQSRLFEEQFLLENIPYKIVGGVNFYARKEIKDLLSYLKIVDNDSDDLATRRMINIPRRGIGAATLNKVQMYADVNHLSFYEALRKAGEIPGMGRSASKIEGFVTFIQTLRSKAPFYTVKDLLQDIIDQTGYVEALKAEGTEEAADRISNIDELINKVVSYQNSAEKPSLRDFLQEVSLVADVDSLEEGSGQVTLMTLHSAKGLEFPYVYMPGMEDGLFPSYMSITAEDSGEALEEERRLCYVGITRAEKTLMLTGAQRRMTRGELHSAHVSRFIEEIPEEMLDIQGEGTYRRYAGARYQNHPGSGYLNGSLRAEEGEPGKDGEHGAEAGKDAHENSPRRGTDSARRPFGASSSHTSQEYRQAKEAFKMKAFDLDQYKVKKAASLDYQVGDRVRHVKFGEGTVLDIKDGGRDYEVTVDFDKPGVKKMFAAFARLQKVQ